MKNVILIIAFCISAMYAQAAPGVVSRSDRRILIAYDPHSVDKHDIATIDATISGANAIFPTAFEFIEFPLVVALSNAYALATGHSYLEGVRNIYVVIRPGFESQASIQRLSGNIDLITVSTTMIQMIDLASRSTLAERDSRLLGEMHGRFSSWSYTATEYLDSIRQQAALSPQTTANMRLGIRAYPNASDTLMMRMMMNESICLLTFVLGHELAHVHTVSGKSATVHDIISTEQACDSVGLMAMLHPIPGVMPLSFQKTVDVMAMTNFFVLMAYHQRYYDDRLRELDPIRRPMQTAFPASNWLLRAEHLSTVWEEWCISNDADYEMGLLDDLSLSEAIIYSEPPAFALDSNAAIDIRTVEFLLEMNKDRVLYYGKDVIDVSDEDTTKTSVPTIALRNWKPGAVTIRSRGKYVIMYEVDGNSAELTELARQTVSAVQNAASQLSRRSHLETVGIDDSTAATAKSKDLYLGVISLEQTSATTRLCERVLVRVKLTRRAGVARAYLTFEY